MHLRSLFIISCKCECVSYNMWCYGPIVLFVKYLVPRFGQHRFDKDNDGETCLDLAVKRLKHNVVEYLQQEGGFADRH